MQDDDDQRERASRITLYEVAAAAGVSKSTVSRILDERLPRSESATAKRVRQAASNLGYIRDVSAVNLRRGTTSTVGIIVPRLTDTVMAMIYEELARACLRVGRFAIVATTDEKPEAEQHAAETLLRRGVDGLVLSSIKVGDPFTQALRARGVPFVLALRTNGDGPASLGDDELGGYLATRHLLDLGHRRIAMIAGRSFASSAVARQVGFRRALHEAGIGVNEEWVLETNFDLDAGADAASSLFSTEERPSAIFAVNDNIAIGAIARLASLGIEVPRHVSIVGYNDIPVVRHLPTPLTTLRVPFDQIATRAIELLDNVSRSANYEVRLTAPTLIPRRSTATHRP
ncbi:LacI family transcriptional regulator [Rhizobium sp. Root1203]|uniref:LacI family DNA-binding transcriptional regulator n=1 Tax=Rhizobium sp. Root1203 TaxID=1736427 RepID=UPI00070FD859|nr:LacI family DNA-binding transcriptional regulator [Rhizobium sp. Root1203]KQV22133.1 LacI family transcriptional regulator [Rhizobium sp. Root1203]